MTLSGGSFGRRYQWDYAAEAWQVAKEMKAPVQLLWTREDDMQHDFYRPYNYQRLSGGLRRRTAISPPGPLASSLLRSPGSNLYTGFTESPETLKDPAIVAALEWYGADIAPYSIPNFRLDYCSRRFDCAAFLVAVRVLVLHRRSPKECFVDELAHASGRDPLQFRMDLLTDKSPQATRVRRGDWSWRRKMQAGVSRCRRAARAVWPAAPGTVAPPKIAEVSVDDDGTVRVHRVVSAVDCGIAVNPDGVRAMTEGAINFALTAVLTGEITIKNGAVQQSNFHDYQVLRINQAPEVEVHIVPSIEDPSGVGELGAMLLPAAVVNAVFAATGVRVRRLPIDPKLLKRS